MNITKEIEKSKHGETHRYYKIDEKSGKKICIEEEKFHYVLDPETREPIDMVSDEPLSTAAAWVVING